MVTPTDPPRAGLLNQKYARCIAPDCTRTSDAPVKPPPVWGRRGVPSAWARGQDDTPEGRAEYSGSGGVPGAGGSGEPEITTDPRQTGLLQQRSEGEEDEGGEEHREGDERRGAPRR